jgi:uncharacterized OsmC-like protein
MTTDSGPRPDEGKTTRIITIEANAKSLEKQRKEGHADGFTMYSDESERLGGDNSAPSPMRYMALSVAF